MNDKEKTISYYNNHSEEFVAAANSADMKRDYERFLRYVPEGGSIIDMGCGSGRDLKYYKEHGYLAEGLDASEKLCELARDLIVHLLDK